MKLKIFNTKLLLMCALLMAAPGSFAQQNKVDTEKDYKAKMQKLQDQMRDLQKQMNKLQTEKFKEQSLQLQKLSGEISAQALAHVKELNVSGLTKGLGVIAPPYAYRMDSFKTPAFPSYNFNYSDDGTLQERIQNGEVKEKTKTYTKSYPVDANDKLQIDNTYGKVTVNTWTKNEIKVDVQMKAYADEEDDAQKMLDKISINDNKENSVISFKTNFDRSASNNHSLMLGTWFSSGKRHTSKLEVNYVVYMPAKSQLDITNKFGSVTLPDLSGKVNLKLSYGALSAQQLNNSENYIKVSFGDAKIISLIGGEVAVSYGSLTIGLADNLKGKVSFGSMNVDRLKTSGDITARYGDGITVGQLDKNCKNVNVDAQFTKVNLGVKDDYNFNVTTRFGSFNYNDNAVKVLTRTPADSDRHYTSTRTFKGQVNKGSSEKTITIKSSYANVKIEQ